MTSTFKDLLKKYLGEVVAIFIGISISFWFDEWRENRKDRELEQKILLNLKDNLRQDSLVLGLTMQTVHTMVRGSEMLFHAKPDAPITDSVRYYIDMAASYTGFLSNQTTYEEMKQTGHSSLIQDDTLKNYLAPIINLPYCYETTNCPAGLITSAQQPFRPKKRHQRHPGKNQGHRKWYCRQHSCQRRLA